MIQTEYLMHYGRKGMRWGKHTYIKQYMEQSHRHPRSSALGLVADAHRYNRYKSQEYKAKAKLKAIDNVTRKYYKGKSTKINSLIPTDATAIYNIRLKSARQAEASSKRAKIAYRKLQGYYGIKVASMVKKDAIARGTSYVQNHSSHEIGDAHIRSYQIGWGVKKITKPIKKRIKRGFGILI